MDAAVIEFDTLPDAVRPAAQDDDLLAVARIGLVFRLAKARGFVGRIHVGRDRLEFGSTAVDPLEHRIDAQLATQLANFFLARRARHGAQRVMQQAGTLRLRFAEPTCDAHRPYGQRGKPLVGKAHRLQAAHFGRIIGQAIVADHLLFIDDCLDLAQEPWIETGDLGDLLDREILTESLGDLENAVRRALGKRCDHDLAAQPFELGDPVEPVQPGFQTAQRLLHALGKAPPDRHDFADRLHRGRQLVLRALELFEGKARNLRHDVVDRRLEACRRCAGDLVLDLVQRVTDSQLRCDARDREAGGLRSERRTARYARVHLDHDQAAILRIDCELYVRTACFHTDFAQHFDAGGAHDLVFLVGQRQRRCDSDGIARMHAHRIDILDRTDDDAIVLAVAHHLHFVLFPAEERFLDQDFGGRRRIQTFAHDTVELGLVIGDAAARSAKGEAGADDGGQAGGFQHRERLVDRIGDAAARAFQTDLVHRLTEALAVLGLVDGIGIGADHGDAEFLQNALVRKVESTIQRRLPTHRRQHRVGPLLLDDLRDDFRRDRLDIGRVGHFRIGHDRRGIGVHQDDPVALFLERLDRLRARIVELARLADNNGTCANDEDRGDVSAFGH